MESTFKITTHGRAVLAACTALELPVRITRVAFGDGRVPKDINLADVHELVHYVAEGTLGKRQHKDDRLFFEVQYENINHQDISSIFYMSEFMVFITDPETGDETDFLYASLGDYAQVVPPYHSAYPAAVWTLPLVVILSDDLEVCIDAPGGLVTYPDLYATIDALITRHASTEISISTSTSDWVPDTDTMGTYALHLDIPCEYAAENLTPILSIYPQYLPCASQCDLCPVCRTRKGILRVYAQSVPKELIRASLVLAGSMSASTTEPVEMQNQIALLIPAQNWITDTDTDGAYSYHTDISHTAITESAVPLLVIPPEYLQLADRCGLSRGCQTLPGALRVYARQIPEADIPAFLTLFDIYSRNATPGSSGGTGSAPIFGTLPPATADTLGGVKIGEGVSVTPDGTISVNVGSIDVAFATDEEVQATLEEAFRRANEE